MEQQNSAQAFAPAHISGIFVIDIKKDITYSGSMGCGMCLEDGAVTKIRTGKKTSIKINGKVTQAPTTLSVIRFLTSQPVLIETELNIPVGAGLGASGAGAFSTALALNEALSLNKSFNELAQAAHIAEVTNMTGLGDVTGQCCGGVDIRKKAGVPPIGIVDRIPCKSAIISWISFGGISTRSVLSDDSKKREINIAGKTSLKELLKKPTLTNFFIQSCRFAKEIELMSPKVRDAIEAVEAAGGLASQAMLGNTVFAINGNDALSDLGKVHKSRISNSGAHLI